MAGLIDKQAGLARLEIEIQSINKELPGIEGKLNNQKFLDSAPEDVVAKKNLQNRKSSLDNLQQQKIERL